MRKRSVLRKFLRFRAQARAKALRLADVHPAIYLNVLLAMWLGWFAYLYMQERNVDPEIKVGETNCNYSWFGQPTSVAVKEDVVASGNPAKKESLMPTLAALLPKPPAAAHLPARAKKAKKSKHSGWIIPPPPQVGLVPPPPPTVPIPQAMLGPGAAAAASINSQFWPVVEPTIGSYAPPPPGFAGSQINASSAYANFVSKIVTVRHRKRTIALK